MTPDSGQKFRFEIPITSAFTYGDLNWVLSVADMSGWDGVGAYDHSIVEYQYFNI